MSKIVALVTLQNQQVRLLQEIFGLEIRLCQSQAHSDMNEHRQSFHGEYWDIESTLKIKGGIGLQLTEARKKLKDIEDEIEIILKQLSADKTLP